MYLIDSVYNVLWLAKDMSKKKHFRNHFYIIFVQKKYSFSNHVGFLNIHI